jgi:hypothetical protein
MGCAYSSVEDTGRRRLAHACRVVAQGKSYFVRVSRAFLELSCIARFHYTRPPSCHMPSFKGKGSAPRRES